MGINDFIQIGTKIKTARKKKGVLQKDMARMLHIPASTYANYEANRREPTIDMICKIADILDVSVDFLIQGNTFTYDEYEAKVAAINEATKNKDADALAEVIGMPKGSFQFVDTTKSPIDDDAYKIKTIAAHHEGDEWTEEELKEIEAFKEFIRSKRKKD